MESDRQSSRLWPFLKGCFVPLIPAIIGALYVTFIEPEGSSGAKKFIFLLVITPLVAIGFLIYQYTSNKRTSNKRVMMYGTLLVLLLGVSFVVWFNLFAFRGW
tara:strand:+ start:161 stop:469 length:309 start_codon:yes stop_codon:yes gene_type:complete